MHRVLGIPELVLSVVTTLDKRYDVLHFGLTCKTVWNAVHTELWRVANLVLLRKLLPKDLKVQYSKREPKRISGLSRPLIESDWQHLARFGPYIRYLTIQDPEPSYAHNAPRIYGTRKALKEEETIPYLLYVVGRLAESISTNPSTPSNGAFTSLKALQIVFHFKDLNTHPDYGRLLRSISSPLEELEFCSDHHHYDLLRQNLQIVADKWSTSLVNLILYFVDTPDDADYHESLFRDVLFPITLLKSLQSFRLTSSYHPMFLTDADFDAMSSSWPHLRTLSIDDFYDTEDISEIYETAATQRSLTYFATRCPELYYLGISVRFDFSDDAVVPLPGGAHSSALKQLHAEWSSCEDEPDEVVEFIRATFPQLESFYDPFEGLHGAEEQLGLPIQPCRETAAQVSEIQLPEW